MVTDTRTYLLQSLLLYRRVTMTKVSIELKYEIVALLKRGFSVKRIHAKIIREHGIKISRNGVKYHVHQYQIGNFDIVVPPLNRSRTDGIVTETDTAIIRETFQQDPFSSSSDVRRRLCSHSTILSRASVKRAIGKAGYVNSKPRYCQLIRHVNMEKRVEFCRSLIESNDRLENIIFSDECSVQLHNNRTTSYRQNGTLTPHIGKPKHPLKLHVWAGISRKGTTSLLIFDGIMRSDFFVEEILRNTLLPFIKENFGENHRFQQDNDPKHRSKLAQKFMTDNGINWWNDWPSGTVLYATHLVLSLFTTLLLFCDQEITRLTCASLS